MQFKHPEILYFLFLLLIPILVHLFQLRRFKKEFFTNVRFLKEISIQTRKSSQIKKWLLLATRLLLLAAVVMAFAQPFFPAKDSKSSTNELFIVLDNSYSMQAKGQKGPLLKRAIEDLLEHVPEEQQFSLITNTETFWNTDIKSIRRELQNLPYSALPFQPESVLAKIKSQPNHANKDVVFVTDGHGLKSKQLSGIDKNWNTMFVVPTVEQANNVSIDSVFIGQSTDSFYEINIQLKSYGEDKKEFPLALYSKDKLVAKTIFSMESKEKTVKFNIAKEEFNGYATITDNSLTYDNTLYFSISKPQKINVVSIGNDEKSGYLSRIYTADEFNFINYPIAGLDYNQIENQDVIILNELAEIPEALQTTLKTFFNKGGNVILIPATESSVQENNKFLNNFGKIQLLNAQANEKLITKIAFNNPVFQSVFEKQVTNFQYPKTKTSFGIRSSYPPILSYEDQSTFLTCVQNDLSTLYVFAAPINKENSNFQNSPLIVPAFYNMAQSVQKTGISSMHIGSNNTIMVNSALNQDDILNIKGKEENFIPVQQILDNKVKLTCTDKPQFAGNYGVYNGTSNLKNISFNYDRTESKLSQPTESLFDGYQQKESISAVFDTLQFERTNSAIWKWFVILALLLMITEILIQKFVR